MRQQKWLLNWDGYNRLADLNRRILQTFPRHISTKYIVTPTRKLRISTSCVVKLQKIVQTPHMSNKSRAFQRTILYYECYCLFHSINFAISFSAQIKILKRLDILQIKTPESFGVHPLSILPISMCSAIQEMLCGMIRFWCNDASCSNSELRMTI